MKTTLRNCITMLLAASIIGCKSEDSDTNASVPEPVDQALVAFTLGNAGQAYGKDLVVDEQDNFYYTSLFQGTIDEKNISATGIVDNYFAKHDPQGNLVWEQYFGTPGSITVAHGIEVDTQGNIYLTGYFGGEGDANGLVLDFGNGVSIRSNSGYDAFLVKYNAQARAEWAIALGNSEALTEERAWDMSLDTSGHVYISGAFSGLVDFNPLGSPKPLSTNGIGHFMAKYDPDGVNEWTRVLEANIDNLFTEGYTTLDVTPGGHVLLAGVYRGTLHLDNEVLNSQGLTDIFLASFDGVTGANEWIQTYGGSGMDIVSPGAMRVNDSGEAHLTGRFSGTSQMGGFTMNAGSAGNSFLLACDASGNVKWAVHHPSDFGLDGGHRVDFDREGNVWVAGWFRGTTNFSANGDPLTSQGTNNASDVYLAKYSAIGSAQWAIGLGAPVSGAENLSICAGLAVDSQGNAIITGKFYGSQADFNPNGPISLNLNSTGMDDCFVVKYDAQGMVFTY